MDVLNEVSQSCSQKAIVKLNNKLLKKISFSSGADMESLCRLVYWLYIYDYVDLSLKCIDLTSSLQFKQNYNVWNFIHLMWGLKIRILRNRGQATEAEYIASIIDFHLSLPTKLLTKDSDMQKFEARRRSRFTYDFINNKDKIDEELVGGNLQAANEWRMNALLSLIGDTETGLYPELNKSKSIIENTILEYIDALRTENK